MDNELEKMLNGEMYFPFGEELTSMRNKAKKLYQEFNVTYNTKLLEELFGQKLDNVAIEAPFYCDYGIYIEFGQNVFINHGCTILDCAKVKIGSNTLFGPNVQLYCAEHPTDVTLRNKGLEFTRPITIGKNCWLGGNVTVLGGVEIGDNCTIGAGSVVTKSIPSNSIAVGNPCKVVKVLD